MFYPLKSAVIQLARNELKLKKQPCSSDFSISYPPVIYEHEDLTEKAVRMTASLLLQQPAGGEHINDITDSIRTNSLVAGEGGTDGQGEG